MPKAIRREFVGITDQALDALRQRLGQRIERTLEPWCYEATRDNIRHYAHGIGDAEDGPEAAATFRDRVLSVGFSGTEMLADGCGRWKVVLEDVPSVEIAREVQAEAATVDLSPTLELASPG